VKVFSKRELEVKLGSPVKSMLLLSFNFDSYEWVKSCKNLKQYFFISKYSKVFLEICMIKDGSFICAYTVGQDESSLR